MTGRTLTISVGGSRKSTSWAPMETDWAALCERLRTPIRGKESHEAYMRMPKAQQDALKDIGGFVGGTLRGGRRKAANVTGRDLVTLDLDAIRKDGAEAVRAAVSALGCASAIYSTRKHDPSRPRLRVILPMDRTVTAEEYEPIARRVAEWLGIEQADPTTFESWRLMYWPSASADSEFIFDVNEGEFLSADNVLKTYRDWHDMRDWPQVPGQQSKQRDLAAKQEDPEGKKGVIGAFCRVYSIRRVMDELIPGVYEPTDDPDRFTYTGGSTSGGAILYEEKWLYSHHATDPCSGRLVNAWDLARLHLYGDRDAGAQEGTPVNKLPSYQAMQDFAISKADVKLDMMRQQITPEEDFGAPADDGDAWMTRLACDRNGNPKITAANLDLIFHNDPNLRNKFGYNGFRYAVTANDTLPWNAWATCPRDWTDPDDASLRNYFDQVYGLVGKGRISDMFVQVAMEHRTDDVRDYLERLEWDEIPRVETLLVRYLKADDTPYTRAVTRKALAAAVARTMNPGCKFDSVLTLIGAQGIAKSMFVDILGGKWYNDSIQTFTGKEAQEQLRGSWLVEIPEVDRFSTKFDSAIIKQFITRRDDIFRESYGHRTASHPRRCIFIATTNNPEFLVDATGNRRWWVVCCHATSKDRGVDMKELREDRDQVWAEAVALWRAGESLELDGDLADTAMQLQESAQSEDPWRGMIAEWLDQPVPVDWKTWDLDRRRMFWSQGELPGEGLTLVPRETVCIAEVWCELMQKDKNDLDILKSRRIGGILRTMGGWKPVGVRVTNAYGGQKTFKRD